MAFVRSKNLIFWRIAQAAGVLCTGLLVVGLFIRPEATLSVLWDVIIPLLPAVFLVAPALWRGVCPLATLNMMTNGKLRERGLADVSLVRVNTLGIVLLFLIVPARHFLFNEQAAVLAGFVVALMILALGLGALFSNKAGFCNAICPVLPVEKLYGQQPLFQLGNARCSTCKGCTPKGCMDLIPTKSALRALGSKQQDTKWLTTPFGIFAGAFPGFVAGYFMTPDGALADAGSIYLTICLWSVASYAVVSLLARMSGLPSERIVPGLAAVAAGLYYWFASPALVEALGGSTAVLYALRIGMLVFIWMWLLRAQRRTSSKQSPMARYAAARLPAK